MPAITIGPDPWRLYRPAIVAAAVLGAIAWSPTILHTDWWVVAVLVVLGNLADLAAVRIQHGMRVSAAHFAAPFAIIATSGSGGVAVAAGCLLGRLVFNRRDWNTFDMAVNVLAATVAGAAFQLAWALPGDAVVPASIITVVVFALVRATVNHGWASEARSRGIAIPDVSMPIGRLMISSALLFTPAIALYRSEAANTLWAALLLVLPFVAVQFLIRSFGRERQLNEELKAANVSITESLVNALDARDAYSAGHSIAVATFARDIASEIGLSVEEVRRIHLAGLLHDIGKIAVPDAILQKPGALTDEEFAEIRKHPVVGEQILAPSMYLQDLLPGVRHHHERLDGKGYPDRLRDEEIPLMARIIAVADAYDAMTSDRPYRDGMPPDLAVRVLVQNQGMQHDPFLVSAFRRVLAQRGSEYAKGRGTDFMTSSHIRALVEGPHLRAVEPADAAKAA